jgi:tetratricopeptide (TPR) repeat protein
MIFVKRHQRREVAKQAHTSESARFVNEGLRHHQGGRLDQASALYLKALAVGHNDADALNFLGVLRYQQGNALEAVELLTKAIATKPNYSSAHSNLGAALREIGRTTEAEASCREALRLQPEFHEAHNNLGNVLRDLGRPAEAEASYREALRLRPDDPEAHRNLGAVLRDLARLTEAEASCREALRLRPDFRLAHNSMGNVLRKLGRPGEAEASYREALRLGPHYPEAHNNLGTALRDLGRLEEAEARYRDALRLRPDYVEAHKNLGAALRDLHRLAEAEASCREALRLKPDDPEAHANLSFVLLLAGRLKEGWQEYEWRLKTKPYKRADGFSAPLWSGETIGNRVILLHAEQGLGDTLQFCRYVPLIATSARTVLVVQPPLVRLLSRLPGITEIIARGKKLPSYDLHCSLLSVPHLVSTTLDTIPAATPYLAADPALAANWRERLAGLPGLRVGLVWAGGKMLEGDSRRSITLDSMAPLAQASGVSFISLQKGEPAAQAANPPAAMDLHDFTADLHDFADTAALVDGLDLVISVDTAVAHLAGALGKPVWLLNRFDTDWRWLLDRYDSPWYPTLRQFRQPAPGDWVSVIRSARDALQRLAIGESRSVAKQK